VCVRTHARMCQGIKGHILMAGPFFDPKPDGSQYLVQRRKVIPGCYENTALLLTKSSFVQEQQRALKQKLHTSCCMLACIYLEQQ
jgi:hypothetical protein